MHTDIIVPAGETMFIPVLWTGKETEITYQITLAGKGATIKFLALLIGKKSDVIRLKTTVRHAAPETKSEVIIKSALQNSATVHFEGLVKIDPGAKGTHAWLAAHILLLSERAKGLAIPSLEIEENDIKAGHATTVGRVNELELFYLMSRGISKGQARLLIVQGFLQSVIDTFPADLQTKAQKELFIYE